MSQEVKRARPVTLEQVLETPEYKSFYEEVLRLYRGPSPPGLDADPTRTLVSEIKKKWIHLIAIIPVSLDANGHYNGGDHRSVRMRIDVNGNLFQPSGKVVQGNIFSAPYYGFDVLGSGGDLTTKNMRSPSWVSAEIRRWKPYLVTHPEVIPPLYLCLESSASQDERLVRVSNSSK